MQTLGELRSASLTTEVTSVSLPMEGLKPGPVMIVGDAQNSNMLKFNFMLDFGLDKVSLPPVLEVKVNFEGMNATWDASGLKFTLKGEVIDPDGEDVSLSLSLCGSQATDFTTVGKNWEIDVSIATCVQQQITEYDVTITATDESGVVSELNLVIKDTTWSEESSSEDSEKSDSESTGLPGVSFLATLCITLFSAAFFARRRDE